MNWLLLKNSLIVSALATVLAMTFGLVGAMCVRALSGWQRNAVLGAGVIALALPPFLVTNCWLHYLGHTGVWRRWLPWDIFSLGGNIWILAMLTWPITMFVAWSAWQPLEAAQLESDPALRGRHLALGLLLPLARESMLFAGVLTFVLAINNFAVPAILQLKVEPAETWVLFNTSFDTAGALRMSWPLIVIPLLLLFVLARRGSRWPRFSGGVEAWRFRQQLGSLLFWASATVTVPICLLSAALPLFQLMSVPRTWTELPGAVAAGQSAIWNSAIFASGSATIVITVSLATAMGRGRGNRKQAYVGQAIRLLAWLPFLVPGVLLGIALITIFNRPLFAAFYQGLGIVILAFFLRYLAIGLSTTSHAVESMDQDLTDAARLEGSSPWQMVRYVYWPQISSQVTAIWYVVFLLCLWDAESMILVVPPGRETLALRIFNLLHYGHNAQVNALCLVLLGLAVVPLLGRQLWRVRFRQMSGPGLAMNKIGRSINLLFLLVALGFSAGCGPQSENGASIESRIFSRVQIIGSRGAGVGQLNKPRSVVLDGKDNLFVVDMTGRVQKFSSNGNFLLSWQMPQTDLGKPKGMCRDLDGNIVVVEPHYQRINYFSPEGKLTKQWGQRGTNAGEFILPRAVAINSQNEIFVSEYSIMERVQKFVLDPGKVPEVDLPAGIGWNSAARVGVRCLATFGKSGNAEGDFNRPEGLCVDAQDHLYVADSCNHRIQIFSKDGKFIRAYGHAGSKLGELSYPYDICVDKAGRQYVCEFGNSRIQIFDANDRPIEIIGGPGGESGSFGNPWGVALDSAENLYVADSQNHRVQKFLRKEVVAKMVQPNESAGRKPVVGRSQGS